MTSKNFSFNYNEDRYDTDRVVANEQALNISSRLALLMETQREEMRR